MPKCLCKQLVVLRKPQLQYVYMQSLHHRNIHYEVKLVATNIDKIRESRYASSVSLGFGIEDTALEKHCTCDNSLHACKERARHRVRRPDTQHTLSWLAIDHSLVERAWTVSPTVAQSSDAVTPIAALSSDAPGSTPF